MKLIGSITINNINVSIGIDECGQQYYYEYQNPETGEKVSRS